MKKLVRVLLAGVMCASLLTACGSSSDTGTSGAANGGLLRQLKLLLAQLVLLPLQLALARDIHSLDPA